MPISGLYPAREFTGIGGSSMGALISIYAGLMYPEVYSKLMIFSPALWVTPRIHFHFMNFGHSQDVKAYLYAGGDESETMIPNVQRFQEAFKAKSTNANFEINLSIDPQGKHNEAYWGREFPLAIEWLFYS
jgi:predicted alpha/beta superfamily hydrolase